MAKKCRHEGENYKYYAIDAAKDLGYSKDIIRELEDAKTDSEVERIMRNARLEKFK